MLIQRLLIALLLLLPMPAFAADSTVSALTAASALGGTELFYCVQTAADRKCTASQVGTFVLASPTLTGTPTIPSPFTLGATSVTSTGTQLNLLNAATGTTGTASTNIVYSTSPTLVTPVLGAASATSVNGVGLTGTGTITATASTSIGAGQYLGVAGSTAATAGNIGEYIPGTTTQASPVAVTSAAATDVKSITLTAGEWSVCGNVGTAAAGSTIISLAESWISTTSATRPTPPNSGAFNQLQQTLASGANAVLPTGCIDIAVSGSTSVFLSTRVVFSVSTMGAYGFIGATRTH